MRGIANSTVAMTAYNSLASCSGGRTLEEIADMVSTWAAQSRVVIPGAQIREAVGELILRGLVRQVGPLLDVTDALRRPVVKRDRSDAGQDDPGWRGWQVYARPMAAPALVSIDEVTR